MSFYRWTVLFYLTHRMNHHHQHNGPLFLIFESYSKSKLTYNFTVFFYVNVISCLYVVLSNVKNHDSTDWKYLTWKKKKKNP